jgi:hypothetical protein
MLSFANSHERDSCIQFKEVGHVYTIRGHTNYISITTFVKSLFEEFDADLTITKILGSKSMNNPEYKYYGMTYSQISDMWGTTGKDNGICAIQDSPEVKQFHKFVVDFAHLKPYRTEWMIF